jgi:hypothetical protein
LMAASLQYLSHECDDDTKIYDKVRTESQPPVSLQVVSVSSEVPGGAAAVIVSDPTVQCQTVSSLAGVSPRSGWSPF